MPSCSSTPTSAPASCSGRTREDAFLDGRSEHLIDGTDLSERFTVPESSAPSSAVLVIDAELGVGSMEVRRATS